MALGSSGAKSEFISPGEHWHLCPAKPQNAVLQAGFGAFQEQLQAEMIKWDRCSAHQAQSSSSALQEWLVTHWGEAVPCRAAPPRHEGVTQQKHPSTLFNKKGLQNNTLRMKICFPVIYTNIINSQ